ncbi:hypothetical protein [Amycolatopsis sp. NPDC051071]|uniref:hypothetical protein n=1 Tax=Amycolatopsis sp. NPDC051071 TaxID=3154637 RepID=UPI00342490D1
MVALVRPSTVEDVYDRARLGVRFPGTGGTRNGYDQAKSPVCSETSQVAVGDREVALLVPTPSGVVDPAGWSPVSAARLASSMARPAIVCCVTGTGSMFGESTLQPLAAFATCVVLTPVTTSEQISATVRVLEARRCAEEDLCRIGSPGWTR